MKFQSAYSDKVKVKTINKQPTMTKQALKDDADVNNIIRKYEKTGILQNANNFEAQYGDFDSTDFNEAMNIVAEATSLFEQVPSDIRAKFKNDPGAFIDYATDPVNNEQMVKWGLANPIPKPTEPSPVQVTLTNPQELIDKLPAD